MTKPVRPEPAGDERAQLTQWLQFQRDVVVAKVSGLRDEDAHRSLLPTSPLMTVAGLVTHLRWVEHWWLQVLFLGRDESSPFLDTSVEDADMRVDAGAALSDLVQAYVEQWRRSDEVIAANDLSALAHPRRHRHAPASLRWVLVHLIEETARHAGHLDLIREMLDGETGYY